MASIKITICEAYNLSSIHGKGYSNPYVVISGGTTTERTTVKEKVIGHTVWEETLEISFSGGMKQAKLSFTVWDVDEDRELCIGYSACRTMEMLDGSLMTALLSSRPGRRDSAQGKITYRLFPGSNSKIKIKKLDGKKAKSRIQTALSKNTTELDLTNCNLKNIPKRALKTPIWTLLDIGFNHVNDWPDSITAFGKTLKQLLVSSNGMTKIGASLGKLTSLDELYFNQNCITACPPEISCLKSLKTLSFENNVLESIAPEIGNLSNLRTLKISDNPIITLPRELGNCTSLVHLSMNCCMLKTLPEELYQLQALKEIDIGFNQLTELSESISKLSSLHIINLSHNKLTDLPYGIGACPIDNLNIDANPLSNNALLACISDIHKLGVYIRRRYNSWTSTRSVAHKQPGNSHDDQPPSSSSPDTEKEATISSLKNTPNSDIIANMPKWTAIFIEYLEHAKDIIEDQSVHDESYEEFLKQLYMNGQRLCIIIRSHLTEIKKIIMMAKSLEGHSSMAAYLANISHLVSDFIFYFQDQYKQHPVQLFQHETKLQQQKKIQIFIIKELDATLMTVLSTLIQKLPDKDLLIILEFIKGIFSELKNMVKTN